MKEIQILCRVTGKTGYSSFGMASRKLREMLRSGAYETQRGFSIHIYRCTNCSYYHIGNNMRRGKAKLKGDFNEGEWGE
jgi:hypothetical protein